MPLDLGNIPGSANRHEHAYAQALDAMQRRLSDAAAEERATHAYQNRTGGLEASTVASEVQSTGSADFVTLEAGMEYASYVNDRGFMRIDDVAAAAEVDVDFIFDGVAASARVL